MKTKFGNPLRYLILLVLALFPVLIQAETNLSDPWPEWSEASQQNPSLPNDLKPEDVIHWDSDLSRSFPDGSVLVGLRLSTENSFALYEKNIEFSSSTGYFLSKIIKPDAIRRTDPVTGKETDVIEGGDFFLLFQGTEPYSEDEFPVAITFVGCTELICLTKHTTTLSPKTYPSDKPEALMFKNIDSYQEDHQQGSDSKSTNKDPSLNALVNGDTSGAGQQEDTLSGLSFEDKLASKVKSGDLSLFLLLLALFLGGMLTNLTPCVYPMIPITIRLLSGQGKNPWIGSGSYAAGIIVTYSALGIFASLTGSMFGQMMASPGFNIAFAIVMALLGLTMLGFGNFSGLQSLGNKIGTGKASPKNAFFMGAGAGLVASPCTGPILAALLAYTSSQPDPLRSSLLMLTYSIGFGIPYIFLGGAAARLSGVRVAPSLQVAIKMIFASLMFGLSLYYLRIPAYSYLKTMDVFWQPASLLGISTGIAGSLYLLSRPSLQHRKGLLLIPAFILGIGTFSGSQWIAKSSSEQGRQKLTWIYSEEEALRIAKITNQPVLIDMWAEWCEACKKMDATTFSDPQVISLLNDQNWILLKLDLTESNDENDTIQEKYQVGGLPTLIIMPPGGQDAKNYLTLAGYTSPQALTQKITKLQSSAE